MELGLATFVDSSRDVSPQQRLRDLVEEAELADQLGLDVFAVGEHHRPDFLVSAPAVVLAALAMRTETIRLSSAVTVLSSDDPVRVFEEFAEVDLLSGGRAEIMAGRGSFTESFPLFGYDLADYDALFAEKLDLLLAVRDRERVTWAGAHRAALVDQPVYPRPVQDPLPVWVAVGGNPQSVVRAGALGLPLALAIIGGGPGGVAPGPAAGAGDHRGGAGAVRATGDPVPPGRRAVRARAAADLDQLARLRRRHLAGRRGQLLRDLRRGDDAAGPGARVGTHDPRPV